MFDNDRTFCSNRNCDLVECYRHQNNIQGKPCFISISDFENTDICLEQKKNLENLEEMRKLYGHI